MYYSLLLFLLLWLCFLLLLLLLLFIMEVATLNAEMARLRKGGWCGWENLIELKVHNSSFSSSNLSIRVFRAYPLFEIRQAAPCRAMRGSSISVNSTLPPLKAGVHPRLAHGGPRAAHDGHQGADRRARQGDQAPQGGLGREQGDHPRGAGGPGRPRHVHDDPGSWNLTALLLLLLLLLLVITISL